ncbi:phage capsid protein [Lactobacillus brevis] [Lactiplantibacillus mudanjiangensis]|uniref:capsid assembly scaffolding protein Gp46 family protein n=1 Tax=Lactiplantibacillus mudanjiangensis TaxID=1296538 RepID=UPI001014CC28|nr:phage capsid protein [Lactobacillus brevis] [Lactiplantibacillus mudanjiangensis]
MEKVKFYHALLNLQRFADEGGDGSNNGTGTDNSSDNDGGDDSGNDPDTITFKSQAELDSWYDKKFAKSAQTLKDSWTKEQTQQKAYEDMTPAEQRKFDDDKREDELAAREQKLTIGENRAGMSERLVTDGLPATLVKAFEPALSDTKGLDDTYKAVTDAYREAVKSGVEKQLAQSGGAPAMGGNGATLSGGASAAKSRNEVQSTAGRDLWNK